MTAKGRKTDAADLARCKNCELWEDGNPGRVLQRRSRRQGDVGRRTARRPGGSGRRALRGTPGRLLHRAMDDSGSARKDIYLTNGSGISGSPSAGNAGSTRSPTLGHLVACKPWLDAELAEVDPALVVVMGATAARSVLGSGINVSKQRGEILLRDSPPPPRAAAFHGHRAPLVHPARPPRSRGCLSGAG